MIFLLFHIGTDRYAVEIRHVEQVLPQVKLKTIPQAAPGVAGVFNYHGAAVPVVDLNLMALGRPAQESLSTRLVVVHYPSADGTPKLLGMLAERATETARLEPKDFQATGVSSTGAPYLGPVINDGRGVIQWVEIGPLLSEEVRQCLWVQAGEAL
ncbi:MAG: chemotaxis protein CheW [Verrucomicrobiota bacterium]